MNKTTARTTRKTYGAREIYRDSQFTNRATDKKRTQQRRQDRANAHILKGR